MDETQRGVLWAFSGILGLLIGSFLNVCIFRLPRNCMTIKGPRSRCPGCAAFIPWHDNIPVISWVILGGRCRGCRAPISPRYALVELLTGALFLWAGHRALYGSALLGPVQQSARFAVESTFVAALVVSTFIDLDFKILPDEITLPGLVLGLLASAAFPFLHPEAGSLVLPGTAWTLTQPNLVSLGAAATGALTGAGALYLVAVLGKLAFRRRIAELGESEAMGLGDVKFMAMVGAVLGWRGVLLTFLVACLAGSVTGIGRYLLTRTMGYVPFGPFLSAGALSVLFLGAWVDRGLKAYMAGVQGLMERMLGS